MKLKTEKNKYNATAYGYCATMPDGTRTWSCVVSPDPLQSALEVATEPGLAEQLEEVKQTLALLGGTL